MGRFDNTALDQLQQQSQQPAAPLGLQQSAGDRANRFANTPLDAMTGGYVNEAQSWYTGANSQSTRNGWDSAFTEAFISGQEQAAKENRLGTYFEDGGTGVVTWDHTGSNGVDYHFGDVYTDGKKSGNVYDQFDKNTANLMMSDWLFDGKQKAEVFANVKLDPGTGQVIDDGGLDAEIQAKRDQNNVDVPKALQAQEFQSSVEDRTKSFQEGGVDEAIVAGGTIGGGAVAGGLALAATGVGVLPGLLIAGGGAAVGGIGAYLNRDALTEQAARAYEITSMSTRENGQAAGVFTGIQQWSGFGGRLISPLSNTVQGLADTKRGDGVSEFYAVDDQGRRTVPTWVRVADVGASIGDAAVQFASPIGMGLYTTQMTGTIGGEVGEVVLTGGKTFDYTRGGFDSIFTDDRGKFAPDQALAGIGKIGIDVVQLGMARGLAGKAQASQAATGGAPVTGGLGRFGQLLYGGTADAGEIAGRKFILDEAGNATAMRSLPTLGFLAPSEQLTYLSARVLAMRTAAKRSGTLTADDVYRAATQLAAGEKKWTTALVTGMGEGYEEAVQAVLEPYSHDSRVSLSDIADSAVYGFAMGAGMGVGTGYHTASSTDRLYAMAKLGHGLLTGGADLSRAEFDSLPDTEKRARAALSGMNKAVADAAFTKFADDQAAEVTGSVVAVHKLADAIQAQLDAELATINPRTDGAFVITQQEDAGRVDADGNLLPGSMPADGVGASARQTGINLVNHLRGVEVQLEQLKRDVAKLGERLAAEPDNSELSAAADTLARQQALVELTIARGRQLVAYFGEKVKALYYDSATGYQPTFAEVSAGAEALNAELRALFNRQFDVGFDGQPLSEDDKLALAMAVGMVFTRDPGDQAGSWQVLVPQISPSLTAWDSNEVLQISPTIRPALTADHDGDKIRPQNMLLLDAKAYATARSGSNLLGAGTADGGAAVYSVNVGTPKYEKWILEYLQQALAKPNSALANYATGTILNIADAIRRRYDGAVDPEALDGVLARFIEAAKAGSPNTRATLLDGLADELGTQLTEFARNNLSNEWAWIDQLVRASLDEFQQGYAAHRAPVSTPPNTEIVAPNQQSPEVKARRQDRAAVLGATMGQVFPGDEPFRQSQKLHYTAYVAAVLSAEPGSNEQAYALSQLYEALGQGMSQSELDAVRAKDEITARVFARLERVSREARELEPRLNPNEALAVVANLRVGDIDIAEDGTVMPNGRELSLAQFLLRQSVAQDRREKDLVFDASPDLQAKHARLLSMTQSDGQGRKGSRVNSSRAFVEIVGAQQLFTLLGDDALVYGPHLTVEQFVRYYVSLDESQRRSVTNKLKGEYADDRAETHNAPYDLNEVVDGQISAFRAVTDAILAVGNNRITMDPEAAADKNLSRQHLHGELADRSYRTGEQLRSAITSVRQALMTYAGYTGRREGELTEVMVRRMFEANPDVERLLLELIPNSAANAALFPTENGQVKVANWVFKAFTFADPHEAEVHVLRNIMWAELNAKGYNAYEESGSEAEGRRKYSSLTRRTHRLIHKLALAGDGGLLLKKFLDQVESATSVEALFRWINTTPGIRGEQAPLVPWVDDVSEFDADKASGGWGKQLDGAAQREAIAALQRGAASLVAELAAEQAAFKADTRILQELEADIRNGGGRVFDQVKTAIDLAADRAVGLGPSAMIYQTIAAAQGFYPQAHSKGQNPDFLDPEAALEAHRDAFGYVTNWERLMASLTSVSLDAVGGNLGQLAKDSVRTMDDYGRMVEWTKPTVQDMHKLLSDPETRPLARAILWPQALERDFDGVTRPKLLAGKSLKSLLNGTDYKNLFPKHDRLSRESALRYVAMVEAEARRFGGHFSVQRWANDIVIARTSAADHVLSVAELEKITVSTYQQIAELLQATASIAAAPQTDGTDPLAELRTQIKDAQRRLSLGGRAPGATADTLADSTTADEIFTAVIQAREAELEADRTALLEQAAKTGDTTEKARLLSQAETLLADLDAFTAKLDLLRADDMTARVVSMFAIPDDAAQAAPVKESIVDYVRSHLSMLQQSSSSLLVLDKLTRQLADPAFNGQPNLSDKEWDQLSRAVIGMYIHELTDRSAPSVSVPPYPDAEHAADYRYWDTTFSYLVDPAFEGPLLEAAKAIHALAGRTGMPNPATENEIVSMLDRGFLASNALGAWTTDIPRASTEANRRLDSAAAPVAISMNGNSPKTQAVVSAATRRTFAVPDDTLLSTTTLTWRDLSGDAFDQVPLDLPSVGRVLRPLAQLNGRFARSVTMHVGGQDFDLLATDPNLGRPFVADDQAAGSGLQAINVHRLRRAIDVVATRNGLDPQQATVEVSFFHPDSQPDGPEWMNNLYFEGTSFKLDADQHRSLNETLWFVFNGINQTGQRMALDSTKLGQPAMRVTPVVDSYDLAQLETPWMSDLAAVLREKTRVLLSTDLGFGKLEAEPGLEYYNAAYKNLKLRHFVRTDEHGLLTAEQVIALQQRGETLPGDATLWIPSDDVLRSMLGEPGDQGVTGRLFPEMLEFDLESVPTFRGFTDTMRSRFEEGVRGQTAKITDTALAHRARQQQLEIRPFLDDAGRAAFDARMKFFRELADDIYSDRAEYPKSKGRGGFSPIKNLTRALQAGDKMLRAENIAFDWTGVVSFVGPRVAADSDLGRMLLHELAATLQSDGYRTGWIYREGAEAKAPAGLLSEVSLGERKGALRVAPGDLVVIELDSFNGDNELAAKRLDYMVDHGAVVVLGGADGTADLRAEMAEYIQSRNYEQVAGSKHVYRPIETGTRYQNLRARVSTQLETRGVTTKSKVAILLVPDQAIEENSAWVNADNQRLSGIAVKMNLVPTDFLAGFNVPVEQLSNPSQIAAVITKLRALDTPEGRTMLGEAAGATGEQAAELDDALRRMFDRFTDNPGSVLPAPGQQFGTGDLIPLVDGRGRVVLYRHGYQAPTREQVERMLDSSGVAIFTANPQPAATVHTGTVIEWRPRSGYGLSVELDVPLQVFGDKKVLEVNGMKYLLTPMSQHLSLPDHGFFPQWGIDMVASLHDTVSKESLDGLVNNHRNAFAYFGVDFLPDVAKFYNTDLHTARQILQAVASRAPRISYEAAADLMSALHLGPSFLSGMADLTDTVPGLTPGWLDTLEAGDTVEAQIVRALLVYLRTRGAKVEHVLKSGGFNDGSGQSVLMPQLFTKYFDDAPLNSDLRVELNRRFNQQLHNPHADGTGYSLSQTWQFEVRNADPAKNLSGMLQFAEAHSSGDNPLLNGMSFNAEEKQSASRHSAAIAYQATGARTALAKALVKARGFLGGQGVTEFNRDSVDGGVWRMLTNVDPKDAQRFATWQIPTLAEAEARRRSREKMTRYRQPIDTSEWEAGEPKTYLDVAHQILRELGLADRQVEVVDHWVRQMAGADDRITGKAAIEEAQLILDNVQRGYLPTVGGEVPLTHVHDLQLLYRVNQNRTTGWAPKEHSDSEHRAGSWDEWVKVSLGSMFLSDETFDPLFRPALDGFLHTYQAATESLLDLPVSVDQTVALALLDPKINAAVDVVLRSSSTDTKLAEALADPMLLNVSRATVDDLLGGMEIAGRSTTAPASNRAKKRAKLRRWRKENHTPMPVDQTLLNLSANGAQFIDHSTVTSGFARIMLNARVGTALINPALYVSMGPEQWIRGTLDRAANLLTGQATTGKLATTAAKVGLSHRTTEELVRLGTLYDTLGARADFRSMLNKELWFLRPHEQGISRIERLSESYAKVGARMQDPTRGMRQKTLARRYVEAVLQHIEATPAMNVLSIDTLATQLTNNPTFLEDHFPEAHKAGVNAVAQLRSLKETVLSRSIRGVVDPLATSQHAGLNLFGNLVLKMPLLFSGYAMNVITTITGMQGVDQMLAMALEGRAKGPNSLFGRIQAVLNGREFDPETDAVFDMSSVTEGIDLTRAFLRGGLTHASLFAFAMMAGGLGLSGEDDETKKRRRLSQLQGAPFVYDPRRMENDFRNADAIYLDWLPFGLGSYFRNGDPNAPGGTRDMAQMHWMLRQFISPIIGIEKFSETGDFNHVTWGFQDAVGAFPLINTLMWDDAVATANELAQMADDQQKLGGPANMAAAAGLLTNAVGVYERMLFENSFINQLYTSLDPYDRDPYTLPLRDSNGTLQRDITGNARRQDVALEPYVDPETGQVVQGYLGRTAASGTAHALTENRATMAFALSMFTGLSNSDYLRWNMPIKTRTLDKPEMTQNDAEALVRAISGQAGGAVNLSASELSQVWKNQAKAAGVYVDWSQLDAQAARQFEQTGAAPMSVLDAKGREQVTNAGVMAIMHGLRKGSVELGSPALQGVYITYETRQAIQKEWMADIIQEGIDLGLDQTKATSRMNRLWYGPTEDPSVMGLGDILWSDKIPYSDSLTYNQLNTTYVLGPDGRPWATGFTRGGAMAALGLAPFQGTHVSEQSATGVDGRLNTVDYVNGVNTGLRALELVDDSRNVPTQQEIAKEIEKAIAEASQKSYTPYAGYSSSAGGGYGYGGYGGYGGHRGGGGYSSGGYANFSPMYQLPTGLVPYNNSIPMINTSNPIIRRADVRRERVWSERGRLNQWQ